MFFLLAFVSSRWKYIEPLCGLQLRNVIIAIVSRSPTSIYDLINCHLCRFTSVNGNLLGVHKLFKSLGALLFS